MKRLIINNGDRFGYISIIREQDLYVKPSGQKIRIFEGKCICGKIKNYILSDLTSGNTKSCGCMKNINIGFKNKKHGLTKTNLYGIYLQIKNRCNNKNHKSYKNYGGRGIKYIWNNFEDFYNDMGKEYNKGLSIDRIDVNGNYCKENCRWITQKQQQRNRRNNIIYKGKCLSEICENLGLNYKKTYARIKYYGWSINSAIRK